MKSGPVSIARLVKVAMITLACGAVAFAVLLWPLIRPYVDELADLPSRQWSRWERAATESFAKRYTKELDQVDRVELLRLENGPVPAGSPRYKVPLYKPEDMKVVQKATLTGAEAEAFASLWRTIDADLNGGAACHEPHHVVRFFSGGKSICDIVICLSCDNMAIPVWFGHELVNIRDFVPENRMVQARIESLVGSAGKR